jgi:peptidyl-prolyl cis-trans isomerase D
VRKRKLMLQTIRERLTGWFAIFILGAIALTLVVTFGNIDTGFSGGSAAATVNGEEIPFRDFQQLYERQKRQWEANYRAQLPDMLAEDMAQTVIQSMIRNTTVAQHVRDSGYRVNDDDVIESITSNPAFFVGGKFSEPAYQQLLASQGLASQRFEYEQRQSMQIQQFIEGIGYTAFYTPAEFRRYIELDGETRDISYFVLAAADKQSEVEVSGEAIEAYYSANKGQFQTEEAVSLDYIEIDFAEIAAGLSITESDARVYYDENPDEFRGPDERNASHILIAFGDDEAAAEQLALEISERVRSGDSFEALAAEFSADTGTAVSGGNLGWLGAGDAPAPEFEEALFELGQGEISDPVRTDFGFHVIKLVQLRAGKVLQFDGVKDELVQRLQEDAAIEIYGELVDELDERALESMSGLAPVAAAMKLELRQIQEFTRGGGEPLGFDPAVVELVFSPEVLEDGENSPVIELEEGRAVVVHVTDHRPSMVRPLEDVRQEIEARLRADEAIELAESAGQELLAVLNDGGKLDASWTLRDEVRRADSDLPPDLAAAVFQAPRPQQEGGTRFYGLLLGSGDFAIYTVRSANPGKPELYAVEERDLRKQQLAGRLGNGQANAVVEALVEEASIGVTPDLINTQNDIF